MMGAAQTLVIIGAGHAGAEAATAARQGGYPGKIIILGNEQALPYHRPPLSKAYLQGSATLESLLLKPQAAYEKADVTLRLGVAVTRIDRAHQCVILANGEQLGYTELVIATGSCARPLALPGLDAATRPPNLFYLRNIDDVNALRPHFVAGRRLVLVGAGYIGLEVASVARQCGLHVTVLEAAPRVLARVTAPAVSAFYTALHEEAGVQILVNCQIASVTRDAYGLVTTLTTDDGRQLATDLVIAGIGVVPNDALAAEAGLAIDNGIATDECMRTSDPAIYAIGDCSSHPSLVYGRRIRLESVPNALEQARCVAAVLTGSAKPYVAVPWFWSDQYALKLQMVGLSQGYDEVVVRGELADKSFVVFYLQEGALIAADCINRPLDFMPIRKIVTARAAIAPTRLADTTIALKEMAA